MYPVWLLGKGCDGLQRIAKVVVVMVAAHPFHSRWLGWPGQVLEVEIGCEPEQSIPPALKFLATGRVMR